MDQISTTTQTGQALRLNRAKALQQRDGTAPKNDLETLFGQAFTQLHHLDNKIFQAKEQAFTVNFMGEGGIDAGGLYRDSLSQFWYENEN